MFRVRGGVRVRSWVRVSSEVRVRIRRVRGLGWGHFSDSRAERRFMKGYCLISMVRVQKGIFSIFVTFAIGPVRFHYRPISYPSCQAGVFSGVIFRTPEQRHVL